MKLSMSFTAIIFFLFLSTSAALAESAGKAAVSTQTTAKKTGAVTVQPNTALQQFQQSTKGSPLVTQQVLQNLNASQIAGQQGSQNTKASQANKKSATSLGGTIAKLESDTTKSQSGIKTAQGVNKNVSNAVSGR